MGKTRAARSSKVKVKSTKLSKEQVAEAARQIVGVALAGAILESVAQFLAEGRASSPQEQAWRKEARVL